MISKDYKKIYLSEPGLMCCAGLNKDELYQSCITGNKNTMGIRKLKDENKFPVGQISRELPKANIFNKYALFENAIYTTDTRIIRIIDNSLEQIKAKIDAAISKYGTDKISVCFGTCDNGSEGSLSAHKEYFKNGSFPEDYSINFQSASFLTEYIACKFGIKGPVFTVATACASGASAIIRGAELIRSGLCSAVIAGGADVISEMSFLGFNALEAMSCSHTNPLSKNRKGLNLGEGAAFFLLDSEEGEIELLGTGESADAYHMTAPGQDGAGPAKAMKIAIAEAKIDPSKIGYVNLHGTGTPLNDKTESLAMKTVFGEALPKVSSTKPYTGHTLGAAGVLEAAICWMVLKEKRGLPVHLWDGDIDEEFPMLPVVSLYDNEQPNPVNASVCMTNSFAFGGCNVSLILGDRS